MRTQVSKLALTTIFGFALTLILSCSGDDGNKDPSGDKIEYGYVEDDAGQVYKTVKIGDQTWMAENLNYAVEGDESYCYNNNEANCGKFGKLYDWSAAITRRSSICNFNSCDVDEKHRGRCPKDWHLPRDEEWTKLMDYIGDFSTAGKYLKTSDWGGNDKYGFAALPSGSGNSADGSFYGVGEYGCWWSTAQFAGSNAYLRSMNNDVRGIVNRMDVAKSNLCSVRCIKD